MMKSKNSDSAPNSNSLNQDSKNRVILVEKGIPTSDPLEFEDSRCPICLDPPHNSVLLECTSSRCHPYICNTSSRHSNCLDQFVQSQSPSPSTCHIIDPSPVCPLCRGKIVGWFVNKRARATMDLKVRECLFANCEFQGSYEELRRHSRKSHVSFSPWDVDPLRRHAWTMIERQHEFASFYFPEDDEFLFSDEPDSIFYSPNESQSNGSQPESSFFNNNSFPFLFPVEEAPVWPSPAHSIDLNVEPRNDDEMTLGGWYSATVVVSNSEGERSLHGGSSSVHSNNIGMPSSPNGEMVSRATNDPLSFSLHWPPLSFSVSDYCADSYEYCGRFSDNGSQSPSRSL